MRKSGKIILGLVAIGSALGAGVAYAMKNHLFDCTPQWDEDVEEDDFDFDSDLDRDLDSVKAREYVPLRTVTTEHVEIDSEDLSDSSTTSDSTASVEETLDTKDSETKASEN